MRIVLLGAPGVGKGTQAKLISDHYKIPHVSTGDIFRTHINNRTSLGIKAKEYIEEGQLVPDSLTISIVNDRLMQEDCSEGFLLDGFPRNLNQAKQLDQILNRNEQFIDKVLLLDIPEQFILERITGRRYCPKCGASYHIKFNPSKGEEKCEVCGENLIQRNDDKEDIVKDRLSIYNKSINPIVNYYSALGVLCRIQGDADINDVFYRIHATLQVM